MPLYLKSLVLNVIIVSLVGKFVQCGEVEFSPKDIKLMLHENESFALKISNTSESMQLSFQVQHGDVLVLLFNKTLYFDGKNISGEQLLPFCTTGLGKSEIVAISTNPNISLTSAFLRVQVYYSYTISIIADIVGWMYFFAWSFSFYPQIYMNYKRKSVVGLNLDYIFLNILGYIMYSIFNLGLYYMPLLKNEYFQRYPRGVNPVQTNDVLFAVHGCFGSLLTIMQCYVYEKGNQTVSKLARLCSFSMIAVTILVALLACTTCIHWLDFIYWCSYVKLAITLMKYVPQLYMNYKRQSTVGWSIDNVLLDLTGGILSLLQMFLLSFNYNDWVSIFGDPTKFGLGLLTIGFDLSFIVQHYFLYNTRATHDNNKCPYKKGEKTDKHFWDFELHS